MTIEEYADRVASTVKKIILDNKDKRFIVIEKINVGSEDCIIHFKTEGQEIVKRYKENEEE